VFGQNRPHGRADVLVGAIVLVGFVSLMLWAGRRTA